MLFGASDSYKQDAILQITLAFNHFGQGLIQRMPRVRWGFVHAVNNDYTHWIMYAIGGSQHPTILSQGNRFIAPPNPNAKEVNKINNNYNQQGCIAILCLWKEWTNQEYYMWLTLVEDTCSFSFTFYCRWPKGIIHLRVCGRIGCGDHREIWWWMEPSSWNLEIAIINSWRVLIWSTPGQDQTRAG